MLRFILFFGLAGLLAAATGCPTSAPEDAPPSAATRPDGLREVPEKQLPPLGDYSPTSDPALEAAGPQGWKRLPRNDEQYLIGYYGAARPNVLPRIFVRGEDWAGQAEDTTRENIAELAAEIDQSLSGGEAQVLERPQAMLLAGEPWVRYVEEARLGNARAEKQILKRVAGGRMYTVELQIYYGKILEARDHAYAVAAELKFDPAGGKATNPAPPDDAAPGDTPSTDEP